LFLKPCNLLVMDEPTNDLDVETLELLEEHLLDFQGTLLLVSHDRAFIDNVVTQLWVFGEGSPGYIEEQVGGYSDWIERRNARRAEVQAETKKAEKEAKKVQEVVKPQAAAKKLSYKLQRELDMLPEQIAEAEAERDALAARAGEADFYAGDATEVQKVLAALGEAEQKVEALEERWLELEEMSS
jgi:ATP-binding cassette subfamily F protein uup